MRILLVGNPSASSVTPRARVVIAKALAADHDVKVVETSRRGHATRLAQGAAADGYEVVVGLGGDGTLNEAANGLAGTSCALGVLPGGSTNVFARTIGLVNDPVEATGQLLAALAQPSSIRPIGLGAVNGRYFLFHVGLGFDAEVVRQVERRGQWKRWAGHPLFAWCGLVAWSRTYDRSRPRFAVRHDDGSVVDDGVFAICQNTNPYTFLGNRPFNSAPDAGLGVPLTMLTARNLNLVSTLTYVASALGTGRRLHKHRHISYRTGQHRIEVTGHGPFPYQVDGDDLGDTERLSFEWRPDVLQLVHVAAATGP